MARKKAEDFSEEPRQGYADEEMLALLDFEEVTIQDTPFEQESNGNTPSDAQESLRNQDDDGYEGDEEEDADDIIEARRKEKDVELYKIVTYVYRDRCPAYRNLVRRFPPQRNQGLLKVMLALGWKEARQVIEACKRRDIPWIRAWRKGHPLPPPRYGDMDVMPILEYNRDLKKVRYGIYLRQDNPVHRQIIEYYETLTSEQKQNFVRVAMVIAASKAEFADTLESLRS